MIFNAVIDNTTMSEDMQQFGVDCATSAMARHDKNEFRKMAEFIKSEFDKKYGGLWGCIIGMRDQFGGYFHLQNYCYLSIFINNDIKVTILKTAS